MIKSVLFILACLCAAFAEPLNDGKTGESVVSVLWRDGAAAGSVVVKNGRLATIRIRQGDGRAQNGNFEFTSTGEVRADIVLIDVHTKPGPNPTIVTIQTAKNPFSFFLRDVTKNFPIYIPEYGVIVCPAEDSSSFSAIEKEIKNRDLKTNSEKIAGEPEASFAAVAPQVRDQKCPTWLGLSRDMRLFEISPALDGSPRENDLITPKNASESLLLAETGNRELNYIYTIGRGQGVHVNATRYLEEGALPILHTVLKDGDIRYHSVAFVALEKSPLTPDAVKGTHYLVADAHSAGHTFTAEQQKMLDQELTKTEPEAEETVLYFRATATNTGSAPRYAWFKAPRPGRGWWERIPYHYDRSTGFAQFGDDKIFCVSKLNGQPLPNEEIAVLVQPGDSLVVEFSMPHKPITKERAAALAGQSFDDRRKQCNRYWNHKLAQAAQISLPEKRIENMLKAGLLHLDLVTYGNEPNGTLAPTIGIYSPIGTESAPIIQFYNSMGWNENARRSLMYFLDKQHPDGLIQNFGGYMVETGAALWSMGEYVRYTGDDEWVKQIMPQVLKSCNYLIDWRNRNKIESLRGQGYGMIDGKVADPEDQFHQYMLNAYGYVGLARAAEMLVGVNPSESTRLKQEAESWKQDIRDSFFHDMAEAPVIPLGDGTWCPSVPPWTEATGPRALYIEPETFFSHGTFSVADLMLGPLYLVFCEVLNSEEQASRFLLNYASELFLEQNCAFSQPYYSRHNWLQLRLGLVKPFLKTYYSTMAATADRETYTFWEHLYHVSPHKTHEEAWFLMQTLWMLYLENGDTLKLLSGVPRAWLAQDNKIEIQKAQTYFGPLNLRVVSKVNDGIIEADIHCDSERKPKRVSIRLPHPDGKKPVRVVGGSYNAASEAVVIETFGGAARIRLEY